MKNKLLQIYGFLFASLFFALLVSCEEEGSEQGDALSEDSIVSTVPDNLEDEQELRIYLIPSPKDLFVFIRKDELIFSDKVLTDPSIASKCVDVKSKEVAFGMYSADLAYAAAFNQTDKATEYLTLVRSIGKKIGLSAVFSGSLMERAKTIASKDSLIELTNDTYRDIVQYLEENNRDLTLSFISAGGWIEAMYIVTSLQKEYEKESNIIQLIADQKNVFDNLIASLQNTKENETLKSLAADLQPIKDVYDSLEIVEIKKAADNNKKKGIVVGGLRRIDMTKEQYKQLQEAIAKVRTALITTQE